MSANEGDQNIYLKALIGQALTMHASDLYIFPKSQPYFRINGVLRAVEGHESLAPTLTKTIIHSLLTPQQKNYLENTLDLDLAYVFSGLCACRINIFYQIQGLAAILRIIPNKLPTLADIQAPEILNQLLRLENGLILVTGPTGSGKSTTMAAMIDYINEHHACHIITIEDPIEYIYPNKKSVINQRQVHEHTQSFASALRAALREDPDIIVVGEMRDLETIRLALTAAETGHLVIATLHTGSAIHSINRIVDVFSAEEKVVVRQMLAESLQAVLSQRFLRDIHGKQMAVFEVLLGTPAIRNLIREGKTAQISAIMETSYAKGMRTLEQSVKALIKENKISSDALDQLAIHKGLFNE